MENKIILKNFLRDRGIEGKCVDMYLFILEFGDQAISVIAKEIGAKRSSCYGYLDKLKKQGFVSEENRNGVLYVSPVKLEYVLNRIEEDLYKSFKETNSQIKHLRKSSNLFNRTKLRLEKPKIKTYTGENALRSIYEESLTGELMAGYFSASYVGKDKEIDDWHTKERVSRNIPVRILIPETNEGIEFASKKVFLKEVKIVSRAMFPFHGTMVITNKHILMYSADDSVAVSIESSYLAENQMRIFDLIWDLTERNYE